MRRFITTLTAFLVALSVASSAAQAQWPYVRPFGFGGYGYGPYAGFGYGPFGGYGGFGPYGDFGYGYGPFNYSQQLYQQQSSLTQQIYQQQQQAMIGQVREAQGRLERLDAIKQQMFQNYLDMSDSEKAAVRAGLMKNYVDLDEHGREAWKRDAVVQIIIGQDLQRLDGVAQYREMSEPDKEGFRQAMRQKYRSLPTSEQRAWQNDQVVGFVMGKDWWLR